MDNMKRLVSLIILAILIVLLSGIVIGYVIGSNVNNSHVQAAVSAERIVTRVITHVLEVECVLPIPEYIDTYVWLPTIGNMGYVPHDSTYVHIVDNAEDNSNVVVTATVVPTMTTITNTPVPSATPSPTVVPTATPEPTDNPTAVPTKQHCDNGVGTGPDCPPPGHDKDNDGISDDSKGNNDDDESTLPCGDPGSPCNKNSKKDIVIPLLILDYIINACINYKNKHYQSKLHPFIAKDVDNMLYKHLEKVGTIPTQQQMQEWLKKADRIKDNMIN
jgi:hypothetical protein